MKNSKTIILRMEPELRKRLEDEAARNGISLSEQVRRILAQVDTVGTIKDGLVITENTGKFPGSG